MNKHTPGPWRVGDAGRTVFGPKTDQPSPKTIADVRYSDNGPANARLIAAAPELLAALIALRRACTHRERVPALMAAEAAIIRATGEDCC